MERLIIVICILSLAGCGTQKMEYRCTSMTEIVEYDPQTKTEHKTGKYEPSFCAYVNVKGWDDYLVMAILSPIFIVAAIADFGSSSKHYNAGGSAYKDYTQPVNQPVTPPATNGAGKYGNYPKY